MKKILSFIISAALLSSTVSYAYELPKSFWAPADRYEKALASDDKYEIISAGSSIVSILENEPKNEQVNLILGSKLYDMGYAYEALGGVENHIKAGECFEKYIQYGEAMGWTDGVKIAKEKSMQFKPQLRLFSPTTETQCYYGAVNEPEKGVLYGQVGEHYRDEESMILLYLEYGASTDFTWPNHIFSKARESGKAIELALNFPYEGGQLDSILSDTYYIEQVINLLRFYSDVPVFLRIGAEVNIWGNKADPELYKQAFRKIASSVKASCSNVATVWSVVHSSEWSINMDSYYPGDEYVDWVGISAYANKYFIGKNWPVSESHNPIVYNAGDAADPVLLIKEVVDLYGDRKPIMLAECGSAYYTRGEINEYSADWAVTSLRRMYSMIPIVYPQVKLIAYFNQNIAHEINYYDLEGCSELKYAYQNVTTEPWFIQKSANNKADIAFEEIHDMIYASSDFELYAYPHVYGDDLPKVNYYIDGTWIASISELPYRKSIDISAYSSGEHTLTAEVESNGHGIIRKDYTLAINQKPENELARLSDYQKNAIEYCKSANIMSGYPDGTVRPYNSITRAEFATMASKFFGLDTNTTCTFDDAANHWASVYINALVTNGAISGVGNNNFDPDSHVTYEQAMKILTIAAGLTSGVDLDALGGYPDAYMTVGINNGLNQNLSDEGLYPSINRANIAVLFYNLK